MKPQNDIIPIALLAADATCFTIAGHTGPWLDVRDYLSVVFDEAPQTQLPPLAPSTSDITVTIIDEDWDELEEDLDKTITPADISEDGDTLSVCASPMICERLVISGWCYDRSLLQLLSRLSSVTVRLRLPVTLPAMRVVSYPMLVR